jgi:hypothetical protein
MEDLMIFAFLFWIISIVVGCIIGSKKGRTLSGFIWPFFFGPLGLLVVAVLPNADGFETPTEKALRSQIALQQQQLFEMKRLTEMIQSQAFSNTETLRISAKGRDLGDIPIPRVKEMVKHQALTLDDKFYDWDAQEWMTLDCCSKL